MIRMKEVEMANKILVVLQDQFSGVSKKQGDKFSLSLYAEISQSY